MPRERWNRRRSGKSYVSAYELYTAPFGSSSDKVFASIDNHPYVAGGFVWSGWHYLGEPIPYYTSRSSYFEPDEKGTNQYRLRWDDVIYEPGKVRVIAYKNGVEWAEDVVKTIGEPAELRTTADRAKVRAEGGTSFLLLLR